MCIRFEKVGNMKDSFLYKILRPIIKGLFLIVFTPKIVGKENIPKDVRIVLAGKHTSVFDALFLISAVDRDVHFLAKKELFDGPFGFIFSRLGLIPVDRSRKSPNSLMLANKYLESEKLVCIFPEGTTSRNKVLSFKFGAVKMANMANSKIVPFVISGRYRLFSRDLKIVFLNEISVSEDLVYENNRLRKLIVSNWEVK